MIVVPPLPARPEALLEPRLPLDEPSPQVAETLLPGDAPRDDTPWEPEPVSGLRPVPA